MARTTPAQVVAAFRRAVAAANAAGLTTAGWTYEPGSPGNGITHKMVTGMNGSTTVRLGGWDGHFLGHTLGEAYATLDRLAQAWEATAGQPAVHPAALWATADAIEHVWVEYTDEDLSELATKAAIAVRALSERINAGSGA